LTNLRFRDNSIEPIDAERLSEFVKLRAYEKITVMPPVRLNQIVSFFIKNALKTNFLRFTKVFRQRKRKNRKSQKRKNEISDCTYIEIRPNAFKTTIIKFNEVIYFITILNMDKDSNQIFAKSIMCSLENQIDFFVDSEHMILSIVNYDYNNYYSFEEVGVTCLFGIVCLLISPHDGNTVLPLVAIPCGTGITKYIISGC